LSAYIPARRRGKGRDEFLSRPRFLAISEFGPQSIIYHEGSRYIVNKVILPVGLANDGTNQARTLTTTIKQCTDCGYIHESSTSTDNTNRCDHCNSLNLIRLEHLLRLQNVTTKRRDRITSDEEERARSGFEIRSGVRFKKIGGVSRYHTAEVVGPDGPLLNLTYGSVIELDILAGEPLEVVVNGCLVAQGEVVIVNDRYGIRLTDIVTPAERLRKINR
jgi:flagellar motor switch protein FliN